MSQESNNTKVSQFHETSQQNALPKLEVVIFLVVNLFWGAAEETESKRLKKRGPVVR